MGYTVEIPKRSWFAYFEFLSERASSCPLRLEVDDRRRGIWRMERALPLVGIDVETWEQGSLEVTVGNLRREYTHRIEDPMRVQLLLDDAGNIDSIRVEEREGAVHRLVLEGPSPVPAWFHEEPSAARDAASPL